MKIVKNKNFGYLVTIFIVFFYIFWNMSNDIVTSNYFDSDTFKIIASTSMKTMSKELISYARDNDFKVEFEYYGDLEIVDILNEDSTEYDAVWISNSIWLYMLDNSSLITNSKSIVIDPVVMAVEKSKAIELGFVDNEIYNKDILNAIKGNSLKYVMASVTKTNTGATTYLSFLNSLAGSPEVLTEEMLESETLAKDLKDFFKGVERVSGDEDYLIEMYKNGDYNAMINYESSLIELNRDLVSDGEEPLYLVYPVDGVAINDMPFAYINNDSNDIVNKEKFDLLQSYLRSDTAIKNMEKLGYRSWYGGVKSNVDKKVFNPDWGIDTSKYLKDMKYPSKSVITSAMNLYIEKLRKPTHVVFCLDVSGSMAGSGLKELKDAMNYILDYETASKDKIQFSDTDKITIITFNHKVKDIYDTKYGSETSEVIDSINILAASGGTNIYDPSIKALEILMNDDSNEYTKTVILMSDGQSYDGSYRNLSNYYNKYNLDIPIYSITFGSSSDMELSEIADLTNAKVFDGKSGLRKAFMEVRSYN